MHRTPAPHVAVAENFLLPELVAWQFFPKHEMAFRLSGDELVNPFPACVPGRLARVCGAYRRVSVVL